MAYRCPRCGAALLVPATAPPSGALVDLDHLPFPVAFPLAHARDPQLGPSERLHNTIFTAYQAMRTTALLLLSDYLDVEQSDPKVDSAIRGLRMPHWGEWRTLCAHLCTFWDASRAERPTHFPTLVAGWRRVAESDGRADDVLGPLLAGVEGNEGPAENPNDALWKLRNRRSHDLGTRTPDRAQDQAALERALPLAEAMCAGLFVPGAFRLVRRISGSPLRAVDLHGAHLDLQFTPAPVAPARAALLTATGVAAFTDADGVSIYPLFAPEPELLDVPAQAAAHGEAVTMVDGVSKARLKLMGVRESIESDRHVGSFMAAIGRKKVDFGLKQKDTHRWAIVDWARQNAAEKLSEVRGSKFFPECYVPRAGVDDAAHSVLERGGHALLLRGEAGSGKSSLMARLVDRLLTPAAAADVRRSDTPPAFDVGARGDAVVYLTGRSSYVEDERRTSPSGKEVLLDAVLMSTGVGHTEFGVIEKLLEKLHASSDTDIVKDRRVWILLDGINEADRFTDLVAAVDSILPCVERYPWLRLVVSMRTGAYEMLERRRALTHQSGGVFTNERHFAQFYDETEKKHVRWLEVRPFTLAKEGQQAYAQRAAALPDRACRVPWASLSQPVQTLLLNPLHLHLFHETWAGRDRVNEAGLDASRIFSAYLAHICEEHTGLETALDSTAAEMLARRQPSLPVEVVERWREEANRGMTSAQRVARLDPVEELVSVSVLLRPAREGFGVDRALVAFTFCHQRMCEEVLGRELRRQAGGTPGPADLARWADDAAAHPGFAEGLGALRLIVADAAARGDGPLVACLLDIPHDNVRATLLEAALRAVGLLWGQEEAGVQQARDVLAALVTRATQDQPARDRWIDGPDVSGWLATRSCTYGALALERASLRALGEPAAGTADDRAWARVAVRVGDYLVQLGRSDETVHHYSGALAIFERLAAAEPDNAGHARDLSVSLGRLGGLALRAGRTEESSGYFEEAFAIIKRLAAAEPDNTGHARELSVSLVRLGDLARHAGRTEEARGYFEEALAINKRLAAAEPDNTGRARDLLVSLAGLGGLALRAGRSKAARGYCEEALAIAKRLAAAEPDNTRHAMDLSALLHRLGDLAEDAGRTEEARGYFEEAFAIDTRLAAAEPDNTEHARALSVSLGRLGDLARRAGRTEEARQYFEEAFAIKKRLAAAEPDNTGHARRLSVSLDRLGGLALRAGRTEEARGYFEQALAIDTRLAAAEPDNTGHARDLSVSLGRLGKLALRAGRTEEARGYFEEALAIDTRLADAEPDNTGHARRLAVSLDRLGDLALRAGRTEEARGYFEEGLAIKKRLAAAEPESAE
jgi:tetratricopeptide (TPR) repeat protein